MREVKDILCHPLIPFKRFEKIVGKLCHASIGLPSGKGLCTPFNRIVAVKPKVVRLPKGNPVRATLDDWQQLLRDMKSRTTHVNELVVQEISDNGNMDASREGTGGLWMSLGSEYENVV